MLFNLIVTCTFGTYFERIVSSGVRFRQVSRVSKNASVSVSRENYKAQRGNNFPFGHSLDVSCVRNDGHFE